MEVLFWILVRSRSLHGSVLNVFVLQDLVPEGSELMGVTDLNDVELLQDPEVEFLFLSLELGKHLLGEVDRHQFVDGVGHFQIALGSLDFAGHVAHIVRVLEESGDRLLACVDALDVLLRALPLLFEFLDALVDLLSLVKDALHCSNVVQLAFDPVVQVGEGVAQILKRVQHRLFEVLALWAVDHQLVGVLVRVLSQVEVLVVSQHLCCSSVDLHHGLLLAKENREVGLELSQEGLDLFKEETQFGQGRVTSDLRGLIKHGVALELIDDHDLPESLKQLTLRKARKLAQTFLYITTLRSCEELELLGVDNEVEPGQLTEVSFEVEAPLLDEDLVFVAHRLLRRHHGQRNTWPSFLEAFE